MKRFAQTVLTVAVLLAGGFAHADPQFVFSVEAESTEGRISSGMKVGSAKDNAAASEPANVRFINVPGVPAGAQDIEIVVAYRDVRGEVYATTTGIFEDGCVPAVTDEGTDVVCAIVFAE